MKCTYYLPLYFLIICHISVAQVSFKLPNIAVNAINSGKTINLSALPKDGKSKVVMISSQSKNDRNLIGKIGENNENEKSNTSNSDLIVPLYIISVTDNATTKIGDDEKDFNFLEAELYEEMEKIEVYFFRDKQGLVFQNFKIQKTPLIFFLDADNNIVFCYENDNLTAKQLINLNNQINKKQIKANSNLYFDEKWFPSTKEDASYYRSIKPTTSEFEVNDYFIDGNLQMKGNYKRVYPHYRSGLFTYYKKNGVIEKSENYVNNVLTGEKREFDENGKLFIISNYKNNKLDGNYTVYYPSGVIKQSENFVDNIITGAYKEYYENGSIYLSTIFNNGSVDGQVKYFYADGKPKATINFEKNIKNGEAIGYKENGQLAFNVIFKDDHIELSKNTILKNYKNENIFEWLYDNKIKPLGPKTKLEKGFKINLKNNSLTFLSFSKEDLYYENDICFITYTQKNSKIVEENSWNFDKNIQVIKYFTDMGYLLYELYFNKNQLINGKGYYENGQEAVAYDINSKNGLLKFYNQKGEEIMVNQSDLNFMKKFKDNPLYSFKNKSVEKVQEFSTEKFESYYFWTDYTINNFLIINNNWLF